MESQATSSPPLAPAPSPLPILHYIDRKVGTLLEDLQSTATIRLFEDRIFDFFKKDLVGVVLFLQETILCYPENLENCSDVLFIAAPFASTVSRKERTKTWSKRESFLKDWLVIKGYTDPNTLFRINAEMELSYSSSCSSSNSGLSDDEGEGDSFQSASDGDDEEEDDESIEEWLYGYSSGCDISDDEQEGVDWEIVQGAKVWYYTDDLKVKKKMKLCHPTSEVTHMGMPWGVLVVLDKDGSFAYISFPQILSVEYPSFSVIIHRMNSRVPFKDVEREKIMKFVENSIEAEMKKKDCN